MMPQLVLTRLIGNYGQAYCRGRRRGRTLADTVAAWRDFAPEYFPLPHPSPRNRLWFKRHPWFVQEVVPALNERVGTVLAAEDNDSVHNHV
jgi:uracil-DNA glycosylase